MSPPPATTTTAAAASTPASSSFVSAAFDTPAPATTAISTTSSSSSSPSSPSDDATSSATPQQPPPLPPPRMSTLARTAATGTARQSLVREVFAHTALAAAAADRQGLLLPQQPPLGIATLSDNSARFIFRLGPLVTAVDLIGDVILWTDPLRSACVLAIFVVLCLFPILFLIAPQLGVISYLLYRRLLASFPPSSKTADAEKIVPEENKPPPTLIQTYVLDTTRQPTKQYLENLRFLQNFMGFYCDVHDTAQSMLRLADWTTDPQATRTALNVSFIAIPIALCCHHLVRWNHVLLVAGVVLLLHRTRLWHLVTLAIPRAIMERLRQLVGGLVRVIPVPDSAVDLAPRLGTLGDEDEDEAERRRREERESIVPMVVFENQRWWAGPGWTPHMLRIERAAWTDETGQVERPAKSDTDAPPPGFVFVPHPLADKSAGGTDDGNPLADDGWRIDREWTVTDPDGWVYSDHQWLGCSKVATLASLTRRRRWVRLLRPVAASK